MKTQTHKRVNISLPYTTDILIEKHIGKDGNRSAFIDQAVLHYIKQQQKNMISEQLSKEAELLRDLNQEVMDEWSTIDSLAFLEE